jgi:hypothetical protein
LRTLSADFDPAVVAAIDARLDAIAHEHHATVLLAIESGSRAWGFPSPDSDYDCRFIYVRRREDYLTLYPPRDVIEFPLEGELDVNGWDLGKALRLLLKGNAVVIEWLTSPYAYAGDASFRRRHWRWRRSRLTRPRSRATICILASGSAGPISPTNVQSRSRSCSTHCAPRWRYAGCDCIPALRSRPCISQHSLWKVSCRPT